MDTVLLEQVGNPQGWNVPNPNSGQNNHSTVEMSPVISSMKTLHWAKEADSQRLSHNKKWANLQLAPKQINKPEASLPLPGKPHKQTVTRIKTRASGCYVLFIYLHACHVWCHSDVTIPQFQMIYFLVISKYILDWAVTTLFEVVSLLLAQITVCDTTP